MAIHNPPYTGQILICDYSGFIAPEMIKRRPVVVISPKPRREMGLCVIVPLSTTAPRMVEKYHVPIRLHDELVNQAGLQQTCWAKCNLFNTLALARFDLIRLGRTAEGKRKYSFHRIDEKTLTAIRKAVIDCIMGGH